MVKDKAGWNKYRHKRNPIESAETELTIDSLTNSGDGLGRIGQRVVFVPYTLPGDRVRIRIRQRKKTFALADAIEILEPGKDRIDPACTYFGQCGGCDWQHVPYELQLQAKVEQLLETLKRIGFLEDLPVMPIVASEKQFGYRNRIQGDIRAGRFHFKQRRSDQRIAIGRCEIAEEAINTVLQSDLSGFTSGRVELAVADDKVSVLPINDKNSTDAGFRQVNSGVAAQLQHCLLDTVASSDADQVLDLYCGRGTWTNAIAVLHSHKHITGVDSSKENIEAARQQARELGLTNVEYKQASVESILTRLPLSSSLCIVDPPRAGLDSTLTNALINSSCNECIYVSCHPATLARDLKQLTEHAFQVNSLLPLDMFPQTAHLECLVVLKRKPTASV